MFDIGFPELVLIMVIALLVFGPGKMAEIGRELGKGVRDFRRATADVTKEFNDALKLDEPAKPAPAPCAGSHVCLRSSAGGAACAGRSRQGCRRGNAGGAGRASRCRRTAAVGRRCGRARRQLGGEAAGRYHREAAPPDSGSGGAATLRV